MAAFAEALRSRNPARADRRWIFVPYDQLTADIGPLAREAPAETGIVLIESPAKGRRRLYHKQKLALVLANMRHFALEQARRGVAVEYVVSRGGYAEALGPIVETHGPLRVMRPAERELREELAPLVRSGALVEVPHEGWLTSRVQFESATAKAKGPPWRMDAFYRRVRHDSGILMEKGKPAGGKYSFDSENRESWPGTPEPPTAPRFRVDAITREVGGLVDSVFADHPGELDLASLPTSAAHAEQLWKWALTECMESFGRFEDAMTVRSTGLFHTRISPLLNLHRLLPQRVVSDVADSSAPLASREGFVRQVLGWREFMHHVHEATDGFRVLPGEQGPRSEDRDVRPSALDAHEPLPAAFWGQPSGLACLDRVVTDVWAEGWSHHITRLMILSNIATLLDIEPRELTDWFWVAYVDAFDWVVEPNVLGMGTYAVGDLMTTKPYVSGAAYINRMSDYCGTCAFDPKRDCPITSLYWAFLARHERQLADNPRLFMPMNNLKRRSREKRAQDARVYDEVRATFAAGRPLTPARARSHE